MTDTGPAAPAANTANRPVLIIGHHSDGRETFDKITALLNKYNSTHPDAKLGSAFNNGTVTVTGSSDLPAKTLQEMLDQGSYGLWHPKVNKQRDNKGNLTVTFSYKDPFDPRIGNRTVEGRVTDKAIRYSNGGPAARTVDQGAAVIAQHSTKITDLRTFGLGPCISVTLYDPETKTGAMAHIDTPEKTEALPEIFHIMGDRGIFQSSLKATVIGGDGDTFSNAIFMKIMEKLDNSVHVTEINIGPQDERPKNINLDLGTGEVTGCDEPPQDNNGMRFMEMMSAASERSLASHKRGYLLIENLKSGE